MGEFEEGEDRWYGFPQEREDIANKVCARFLGGCQTTGQESTPPPPPPNASRCQIASLGMTNLVVLSGDSHAIAMDSGFHTDYNTVGGAAGFPIIHTAPFARYGSSKVGYGLGLPGSTHLIAFLVFLVTGRTVQRRVHWLQLSGQFSLRNHGHH